MNIALVTGVVGGIGYAIAQRLKHDGYRVIISDLPSDDLKRRATESQLPAIDADLSDKQEVTSLLAHISESFGAPQIVVNAAGGVCGQTGTALEHVSEAQ